MALRGNHERAKKSPELSGHKISGNSKAIQILKATIRPKRQFVPF